MCQISIPPFLRGYLWQYAHITVYRARGGIFTELGGVFLQSMGGGGYFYRARGVFFTELGGVFFSQDCSCHLSKQADSDMVMAKMPKPYH